MRPLPRARNQAREPRRRRHAPAPAQDTRGTFEGTRSRSRNRMAFELTWRESLMTRNRPPPGPALPGGRQRLAAMPAAAAGARLLYADAVLPRCWMRPCMPACACPRAVPVGQGGGEAAYAARQASFVQLSGPRPGAIYARLRRFPAVSRHRAGAFFVTRAPGCRVYSWRRDPAASSPITSSGSVAPIAESLPPAQGPLPRDRVLAFLTNHMAFDALTIGQVALHAKWKAAYGI